MRIFLAGVIAGLSPALDARQVSRKGARGGEKSGRVRRLSAPWIPWRALHLRETCFRNRVIERSFGSLPGPFPQKGPRRAAGHQRRAHCLSWGKVVSFFWGVAAARLAIRLTRRASVFRGRIVSMKREPAVDRAQALQGPRRVAVVMNMDWPVQPPLHGPGRDPALPAGMRAVGVHDRPLRRAVACGPPQGLSPRHCRPRHAPGGRGGPPGPRAAGQHLVELARRRRTHRDP